MYRKDSQISRTFFSIIVGAAYLRDHLGFTVSSLPSSDIMPGYTASHSACKKTTNFNTRKILWKNYLEWRNTCEQIPE